MQRWRYHGGLRQQHIDSTVRVRPGGVASAFSLKAGDRPLVLWVVGRRIGGEVLERLRRWRRAGLDARPLVMEVRRNRAGWIARVAGERAPAREDLEQQLLEHLHDHPGPERPRADLHLYQHARPSDPATHGGDLRATPEAIIHPDEPIRLRASA